MEQQKIDKTDKNAIKLLRQAKLVPSQPQPPIVLPSTDAVYRVYKAPISSYY